MLKSALIFIIWNLCNQLLIAQPWANPTGSFLAEKLEAFSSDTDRVNYLLKILEKQYQREPKASLEYAVKALAFARQSGSTPHLLHALSATSKYYFYAGWPGEAARYVEEFADLADQYGTDIDKALAYNALATLITLSQEDQYRPEALKLFEKTLALFLKATVKNPSLATDTTFQENFITTYSNIAAQLKLKGDLDYAESFLQKAFTLLEKTSVNTPLGVRTIAIHMDLLRLQGRERDLFLQYDRGLAIINEMGYGPMSSLLHYPMAQWYASRNNLTMAINLYYMVYQQGVDLENFSYIRSSAVELSKLYERSNNPEAALKFSRIAEESAKKEKISEAATSLKHVAIKTQFRAWKREVFDQTKKRVQRFRWITGLLSGLAVCGFFLFYQMRRKYRHAELKKLEAELSAQKLLLEKKVLEADLEASNKAIATEMMRKLKRNDLISNTIAELQKHSRRAKSDTGEILKSAVKSLNETLEEEAFKEFDMRFQQVDQRFYDKLAEIGPDLTMGEKRVCAFLRLDKSTKEISALTGQSVRAIELMRGRIRKKLGITNAEVSLLKFFSQL